MYLIKISCRVCSPATVGYIREQRPVTKEIRALESAETRTRYYVPEDPRMLYQGIEKIVKK